jgi:uncharacterized protein
MKLFIISDIHGSAEWLERAWNQYEDEQADQIICLGDLLYHGPRNPLPDGYDPKRVADMLNKYKHKIVSVRGNCDAEVDQLLIEFPIMAEYAFIYYEGKRIFITHGHHNHMENLPPLGPGDIFMQGHTHLPVAEKRAGLALLNPGSIALPKGGFPHSYAVLEGKEFRIKNFAGNTMKQLELG